MRKSLLATALLATTALVAGSVTNGALAAGTNRRTICNGTYANVPPLGQSVTIPVTDFAADPDLTPISLVSVFGGGQLGTVVIPNNGTPSIPNDDVLVFTRTTNAEVLVFIYWTVSDGALTAQCSVAIDNSIPPDNG
ncbi:MAG: hypothetical protein L0Y54_22165 [Sporichthyaceae bacterium]|nr:hypothetical protein [Sporichthyaceae bacterium]